MITNIVGLGSAGCNIVDGFAKTSTVYKCYKLDVGLQKASNSFPLTEYAKPEEYEENPPKLKNFFRKIKNEVLFCLGGSGDVSNATLVILEQLKHCKISILYIKPDVSFLSMKEKLQENMVFGVLQELARSGVFERIYITSNPHIEKTLGGLPMIGYYEKINEALISVFHMINSLKKVKPVISTENIPPDGARISTFGFVNTEQNKDFDFFPLDQPTDIVYFYTYNQNTLETKTNLLTEIRDSIKNKNLNEEVRTTFGVYASNYDNSFVYSLKHTSLIQGN